MRISKVIPPGEWFIITLRGRSQERTTVLKVKLTGERATAIERKLIEAFDGGWLVEAHMIAVMLMKEYKATAVEAVIESFASVAALSPQFVAGLDAAMREDKFSRLLNADGGRE